MLPPITRRGTLRFGAGALAAGTMLSSGAGFAAGDVPAKDVPDPGFEPEKGAKLRVLRPSKFVSGDQQLFDENTKKFTQATGIEVVVDYEGWEDLRPKTAVAANVGSGPDVVLSWLDDAFQFPEKLVEVSDLADYLGKKYGGWFEVPAKYGKEKGGTWIALPYGGSGACMCYRKSWLNEAGFEELPTDMEGFLKASQAMKKKGHPSGIALGNAVGDGNNWHWALWAFGGAMVDESNHVIIDSPQTVQALEYAKELYPTFIPGTLSWLDPSNNKAYLAGDIGITPNGISIYYVAKNSEDPKLRAIAEDTYHAQLPIGPVGRPTDTSTVVSASIFKYSKYPNAAKKYLQFMFEAPQYGAWQTACIGYWAPSLAAYNELPFWTEDPKVTPYRDITKRMLWFGYKGDLGYASSATLAEYIVVQMFANVCSGTLTPKEAAAEAARRAKRYYKS